jgi:hypothetical protein
VSDHPVLLREASRLQSAGLVSFLLGRSECSREMFSYWPEGRPFNMSLFTAAANFSTPPGTYPILPSSSPAGLRTTTVGKRRKRFEPCSVVAQRVGQPLLRDRKRCRLQALPHKFPAERKRAKYVPDDLYLTRSCTAVVCQTFSSDALISAVASVECWSNERCHRSRRGADVSLRARQNDAS